MRKLILIAAILFMGCSTEYDGKYEFFVQRGNSEACIEDADGHIIGYSVPETGSEYVPFESATLTVYSYKVTGSRKYETHIRVGEYYWCDGGELIIAEGE